MTKRMGIRDITKNLSSIKDFDYIEIEDKKTKKLKGLLVSENLLDDVKKFIDEKLKKKKQKELDDMMQFVGIASGEFAQMTSQDIKSLKREKYSD